MKSIKFDLVVLFVTSLVIILTFGVLINNTFLEKHYIARDESRLEDIANEVNLTVENKQFDLLEEIEYDAKISIAVVDKHLNPVFGRRHIDSNIRREISNAKSFPIYKLVGNSDPLLVYVKEFSNGYIVLSNPLVIIQNSIQITNDFHIITSILAILIGSIFTIIFSNRFTKPIIAISAITKSMSKLDFSKKIEYKKENELGDLANSINSLSQNLEKNINQLQDEVAFQKVLTRNISHELKTPVAVVKGYVEGVYYGIAETDEEKENYYKIIINECDRMNNLISEMLEFSKISATKFTLSDLTQLKTLDIKEEVLGIFNSTMERQKINFEVEIEDITFMGDHSTIIRVLSNFISNAIKYGDNKIILLSIKKVENNIIISTINTGENIDTEHLTRIFDAFYTLDPARTRENNGHGLGLAIVKSIADLYNGKVNVKNNPTGVEFTFTFPDEFI